MALLPLECAVSLIVYDDLGRFLIVRRPIDDEDDIGGVWGFPAIHRAPGESEEDAARRVGMVKLGVEVGVGRRIGELTQERRNRRLHMAVYDAVVVSGAPRVQQANGTITQYEACEFTTDPTTVFDAARRGSQCTQIFLNDRGIRW
jgi:ADP-ribose pyrophosphatase YjhB (NUDIX family)